MSGFFPAPEAIVQDPALGPAAAVLYGRIWRYCQGSGLCWASRQKLATESGVCVRTITKWVGLLEAQGYIVVTGRASEGDTNVIAMTRKWVMGGDGDPEDGRAEIARGAGKKRAGGAQNLQGGAGKKRAQVKDLQEKRERKTLLSAPVVVVPPDAPHDDDGQGMDAQDAALLEAITTALAPEPTANPAARAARVLAQLRSVAPEATAEDVERAAEDYTARLERRKGRLADPITAGQLPAVVLAWMDRPRAERGRRRMVPHIER